MKSHRLLRVAEMIREVASETILFKMSDPRVKRVTVMRVELSPDLQHAKVHVSVMGTAVEQATTLKGLNHAAGFVQAQLGDRMRTRYTPSLRFVLDLGVKQSVEISRLISEALGRSGTTSADSAAIEEVNPSLADDDDDDDDDWEDEDEDEDEDQDDDGNDDPDEAEGKAGDGQPESPTEHRSRNNDQGSSGDKASH